MTTSRTGTAQYRKWRQKALTQAQHQGITHCPICHTHLDYTTGTRPNSAVPDHIIPYSKGGQNTPNNAQIICAHCNKKLGNKTPKQKTTKPTIKNITYTTHHPTNPHQNPTHPGDPTPHPPGSPPRRA